MWSIFMAHWMKERRNPSLVLMFIGLSIVATFLFGMNINSKIRVDVFTGPDMDREGQAAWIEQLNEGELFLFRSQDEELARKKVREGRADFAVQLMQADYKIISAVESPNVQVMDQFIRSVMQKELQLQAISVNAPDPERFRQTVTAYLEQPPVRLTSSDPDGGELIAYDMQRHLLFGFTLFLVMFTVGFKLNTITKDKTSGVWNRMVLSPLRKTQIYMGHLVYSMLIGIAQIVIVFLISRNLFGFDLGDSYGLLLLVIVLYTMSVVSLSILLVGILRTPEQFMIVFPSMIPMLPLISGAYMPPGTITNPLLLSLAEGVPLTHAMEALTHIAMYGAGVGDIVLPLLKMILISVLCMGIGINLMERPH